MDPDEKRAWQAASKYGSIGIFFGVAIVLGFLGGKYLDRRLSSLGVAHRLP